MKEKRTPVQISEAVGIMNGAQAGDKEMVQPQSIIIGNVWF
jgi:hypothetical protein